MQQQYLGITIDTDKDNFDEFPMELLKKHYLINGETSPQQAFARAATNFCYGDYEFAQRIYNFISNQYASFSSPIISNAIVGEWTEKCNDWSIEGKEYRKSIFKTKHNVRAMPVSCFLTKIPDTLKGQIDASSELAELSTLGGGVGQYFGMRGITKKSPGAIPYLKTIDSNILYYHQAGTRRGSAAGYLDISHPDIIEFIGVRTPTGGDINRKSFNVHIAVNITDEFIDACDNNEEWKLIDPYSKKTTNTINARELWQQIIETRFRTGEPYIHYVSESNRRMNPYLKEHGMKISSSNLCVTGDTIIEIKYGIDSPIELISIEEFIGKFHNKSDDMQVYVKSHNIETNEVEWNLITNAAMTGRASSYFKLMSNNTFVKCTDNHEIYNHDTGTYIRSDEFKIGDLVIENGIPVAITEIQKSIIRGFIPVYDLTVDKVHNFYANGILVHNCSEIILPVDDDYSSICVLSSLNAELYDEWKDTTIVEDFTRLLDNVVQWYIDYSPESMVRTRTSALKSRDIGLGLMGWHYFLMKHSIPFESGGVNSAMQWSYKISKLIYERSLDETKRLARERGEPEFLKGSGLRNAHRIAIAPNANSSIIAQTSASIEPISANIYTHRTRVGSHIIKNKYLDELIKSKDIDYEQTWISILKNGGSIQGMYDVFTSHEQKVFKTANEIDARYIIDQARIRQEFIDQAASTNLFFKEGVSKYEINDVHRRAFSRDEKLPGVPLKTLYYLRSSKNSKIENVSAKIKRDALKDYESQATDECIACHA